MKKLVSFIVSLAMLLTSVSIVIAEGQIQPVTGSEAGGVYTFHIGNTDVSGTGTYNYSDDYFEVRTAISGNDNITAENGLYYNGGGCAETNSAQDTNRYILIKPVYSGTLNVTINFPSAGAKSRGCIYYNDFGTTGFDEVDLTTLKKDKGTNFSGNITTSGAKTVRFEAVAGHTYALHTYNIKSYITALYYELNDPDAPVTSPSPSPAPTPEPTEQPKFEGARQVEYLDRGLVAVKTDGGIFLSWRLLGTEEVDTAYDIYKNGVLFVKGHDKTNYTDTDGFENDTYKVVVSGEDADGEKAVNVWSEGHLDVPVSRPVPEPADTKVGTDYTYSANDASVADVDGDGEYEIILKWDPSNSQDNYFSGYTGNVYVDAYEMDGTMLWRIDMGVNIRAGAHYTQFIAYDFDGDGKAEVAMRTAPGSKDGKGNYITEAGENLLEYDNTKDYRNAEGRIITAPDYLTIFNGETGEAMKTVDYFVQRGDLGSSGKWGGSGGDANSNYADRFLAGVAYVNGETPSLIMCRGYYYRAAVGVYDWDGTDLTLRWSRDDKAEAEDSLYAQGAHSLSISDVDNDGYDEIVYGAAVVDHDGTMLNNTQLKHGDALHVSDFNNDGSQEVFMAHEHSYRTHGAEYHGGESGQVFAKVPASEDVGRGVMGNIIASNPLSEFWSTANNNLYDLNGNVIAKRPAEVNFLAWWDGDLTREVLDATRIVKYDIENGQLVEQYRKELFGTHSNNGTKQTPSLSADIFGDWREEVMYPTNDNNYLRIYTTDIPTEHKLTTLMHDTQYRCAVAWQNVGYNQPPHPSFYVGSEKTEYPSPNVKYAAAPEIRPGAQESLYTDIIPKESFTGLSDNWGGMVTEEAVPYKQVLSVADGWIKSLSGEESGEYLLEFMWKPLEGSGISVLDENGSSIFGLAKSGSVAYFVDDAEKKTISATLHKNSWYCVSIDINTKSQLVSCTIKDYETDGAQEYSVKDITFAGAQVAQMRSEGANMLDNVHFARVSHDPEHRLLTFDITGGENAAVTVDGRRVTADNSGTAKITLKDGEYPYTITKSGFKTYNGTAVISGTDKKESAVLLVGEKQNISVNYKDVFGNTLKDTATAGEAEENESFIVPEEMLADITAADGTVYEFDPDATQSLTANGSNIDLVYKKKIAPVYGDTDITRINLGENGFHKSAVSADAVEYKKTNGGIKYGLFNGDITAQLNGRLGGSWYIEYDILLPKLADGDEIKMTPFSDDTAGTPLSFVAENGNVVLKHGSTECTYTSETFKKAGYVEGQPLHVTISCTQGKAKLLLFNRENSIVYAGYDLYDAAISDINQLVFSAGEYNIGISEIEAYTVGGATGASYPFGKAINLTAPSSRFIVPTTVKHGGEYDSKILRFADSNYFTTEHIDLADGLSYAVTEEDGTAVDAGDVTIDKNTGLITVGADAEKRTVNAHILYNGHVFKTVPVNIVSGAVESFWTEDFEGGTHKFSLSYNDSAHKVAEFHCEDPSKVNAKAGKIYGVGARNGGATGTNSSEIDTSGHSDISVEMDFKLDATSFNGNSYIALLGGQNTADSLGSDKQILTVKAFAGGGNGYWSEISVNGKVIITKIDDPNSSGETAGAGYDSSTKTVKFHALNRDSTGWMHLSAIPDFETQKVNVVISKISSGEIIYSGMLDFVNEVQELKYVFASGGRSYGTAWLDNIEVKGINPDGSYEPPVREPSTSTDITEENGQYVLASSLNDISSGNLVIAAAYDSENELMSVKAVDADIKEVETRFDKIDGLSYFKIMVWDGLNKIKPVTKAEYCVL